MSFQHISGYPLGKTARTISNALQSPRLLMGTIFTEA